MELIPSIDLLDGSVVRLRQGQYDEVTIYGSDPVAVAQDFEAQGAQRLHVVDLAGAKSGKPEHRSVMEAIVAKTKLQVQVGGGIRDEATAAAWIEAGAKGVVLGTIILKKPELVQSMIKRWPQYVIAALDARDGFVAVEGWTEKSQRALGDVAKEVDAWGATRILYTNISRDGTSAGPDVEGTASLQASVKADVIASGGIGSLDHLRALAQAKIRYAICGRALYSGKFTVAQAIGLLKAQPC